MGIYNFLKAIFPTLILTIFSANTFSYTLDEDVLERCGQKHPNDFAGRIVCNNRMQIEICLEKEEGKVDKKINEIVNILLAKPSINLQEASDQINLLKDFKGNYLKSSVVKRSDKPNGDNGYELKILVLTMYSTCTSGQKFLVNILEDKNKITTALRVWIQFTKNEEEAKPFRLSRNDWIRNEEEIDRVRIIKEEEEIDRIKEDNCKKILLDVYGKENEYLNKSFENKNNASEKIIFDRLKLKFLLDDYSVSSIKDSEEKSNIKILSKCDGLFTDMYVNYEFLYTNNKIDKIESAFYIKHKKTETNEKPFFWVSQDYKDREITKIKQENEEKAKKIADDELSEKIKKDGQIELISIALIIIVVWPSIGYLLYYFNNRKKIKYKSPRKNEGENPSEEKEYDILKNNVIFNKEKYIFSTKEKSDDSEIGNIKEKFKPKFYSKQDVELMNEFRSRNPFIKIDVPPNLFKEFMQECKWYEEKTNNFPDKENQDVILKSIEK